MLSYAQVWEVHRELTAFQQAGIIPTPQASDEEVEAPEPHCRDQRVFTKVSQGLDGLGIVQSGVTNLSFPPLGSIPVSRAAHSVGT